MCTTKVPRPIRGSSIACSPIRLSASGWARPWLDLARYADSAGYASDPPADDLAVSRLGDRRLQRRHAVRSSSRSSSSPATCCRIRQRSAHRHRLQPQHDDQHRRRHRRRGVSRRRVKDRVDTTMDVWMGLTIGCAKCHSHKFDPITQKEYYQFVAIFNQTADNDQPDESPTISFPRRQRPRSCRDRRSHRRPQKTPERGQGQEDIKNRSPRCSAEIDVAASPSMRELPAVKQRKTHVMIKGNFLVPRPTRWARRAGLLRFAPQEGRRRIAWRWPAGSSSRDNPLTARVAVNRVWVAALRPGNRRNRRGLRHAGRTAQPSGTARLAGREYMDHGWDTKWLVRLLVTSATYRQSSPHHAGSPRRRIRTTSSSRRRRGFGSRRKWSAIRRSPSRDS